MNEVDLNWQRTLKIWWCMFWRGVLAGAIVGGITGFLVVLVGGLAGVPDATVMLLVQVFSTLSGALVGIVVVWSALSKRYSDFSIVLVSGSSDPINDA